jgi:paraquat-inducible protein B
LSDFENIMDTVNAEAEPILENVREGTEDGEKLLEEARQALKSAQRNVQATLAEMRDLLVSLDNQVTPLSRSVQDAAASATGAFDQIKTTTRTADEAIAEDSPLRADLERALRNLAAASRSIRVLTEELQRDPSAVLRGRR